MDTVSTLVPLLLLFSIILVSVTSFSSSSTATTTPFRSSSPPTHPVGVKFKSRKSHHDVVLFMAVSSSSSSALKPVAMPLLDSGKALATSGESLIELTSALDLYGGALSSAGAQIRNAGDRVAQAAASCRFKTATEFVYDELREAASCLEDAHVKLRRAAQEARVDDMLELAKHIESTAEDMRLCSLALEAAGAGIMLRQPLFVIGEKLVESGECLLRVSPRLASLAPERIESQDAARHMAFAADKMIESGKQLLPASIEKPKPTGKSWLKKGGGG